MKHIDVSRTIHNNLDAEQERCVDDYWNIDGLREWEKLENFGVEPDERQK